MQAKTLLLAAVVLFCVAATEASHFRFGTISWSRPAGSRTVTFRVQAAWRADAVDSVALTFGDGGATTIPISSFNYQPNGVPAIWRFGEATVTRTYAGTGNAFTVGFTSCCRISNLLDGNRDRSFLVQTRVVFSAPNGVEILSSPRTTSSPIIQLGNQIPANVPIPMESGIPAASSIDFTLTPKADSLLNVEAPTVPAAGQPGAFGLTSVNGQYRFTWTPQNLGLYAVQFKFTDVGTGVFVVVDLILEVVPRAADAHPPTFIAPVPPAFTYSTGVLLTFDVVATDITLNDEVTMGYNILPPRATLTDCVPRSSTCTRTFSWIPDNTDADAYGICFTAVDLTGNSYVNGQYCVSLTRQTSKIAGCPNCVDYSVPASCQTGQVIRQGSGKCVSVSFDAATGSC